MPDPVALQRAYYQTTAEQYDGMHLGDQEHEFALAFMISMVQFFRIQSVLDVGSGTGRALLALKQAIPSLRVAGIEPSSGLRLQGHAKGLGQHELVDGDAQALAFPSGAFDLVCSFGVFHHVPDPRTAASEMLRVARKAVFISDHNDYARGTRFTKAIKQAIKATGLWPIYKLLITRGKGYRETPDDGIWYPYSIFETYRQLAAECQHVHLLNTVGSGPNLYRSASHVALLGLK